MRFVDLLRERAAARRLTLPPAQHPEPLAGLDPGLELELVGETLAAFWRAHRLPGAPDAVVAAPLPRGYRTTTKRRASLRGGRLELGFPGAVASAGLVDSRLDAASHLAVYRFLLDRAGHPPLARLFGELSWIVVRGDAPALTLIFNLRRFDGTIIRAARRLGEELAAAPLGVRALWLYLDPTGSAYYLEARRPAEPVHTKRLFGPDAMTVEIDGLRLRHPATSFSQVNQAMLLLLVDTTRALLAPDAEHDLLDLYCGYGLFALTLGRVCRRTVGVDYDGPAIAAGRGNARHLGLDGRVRFLAGALDARFVERELRPGDHPELVLLDPPRQGTAPGLVGALAARRPDRVVHLCCGIDELPRELGAWQAAGRRLARAVPLAMFAGTAALELLLLLE